MFSLAVTILQFKMRELLLVNGWCVHMMAFGITYNLYKEWTRNKEQYQAYSAQKLVFLSSF